MFVVYHGLKLSKPPFIFVIAEPSTSTVAPVAFSVADAFISIVAASSLMDVSLFIFASDLPSKVDVLPSTSTSESASILIFSSASISNSLEWMVILSFASMVMVLSPFKMIVLPVGSAMVTLPFSSSSVMVQPLRVVRLFVLFELPPPVPDFPWNKLPSTNGRFGSPYLNATMTWSPFSGMNTNPLFVGTLSLVPASGVSTRIHEVCIGPVCQFILTWTRPNFFGSSLLTTTACCV